VVYMGIATPVVDRVLAGNHARMIWFGIGHFPNLNKRVPV